MSPLTPLPSRQRPSQLPKVIQFHGLDPSVVIDEDSSRRTRRGNQALVRQTELDQVVETIRKNQQMKKGQAIVHSSATSKRKESQPLQQRSVNTTSWNKRMILFKLYWIAEFDGEVAYQPYIQLKDVNMSLHGEGSRLIATATEAIKEFARIRGWNHYLIKREAIVSCTGARGQTSDEKVSFQSREDWPNVFSLITYNNNAKKTEAVVTIRETWSHLATGPISTSLGSRQGSPAALATSSRIMAGHELSERREGSRTTEQQQQQLPQQLPAQVPHQFSSRSSSDLPQNPPPYSPPIPPTPLSTTRAVGGPAPAGIDCNLFLDDYFDKLIRIRPEVIWEVREALSDLKKDCWTLSMLRQETDDELAKVVKKKKGIRNLIQSNLRAFFHEVESGQTSIQ
ncbi:hypothetical protein MBLNU459_g8201t1 [Dothideomycetes sp. NU459]